MHIVSKEYLDLHQLEVVRQDKDSLTLIRRVSKVLSLQAMIHEVFGGFTLVCGLYAERMIERDQETLYDDVETMLDRVKSRFASLESAHRDLIEFERGKDEVITFTADSIELKNFLERAALSDSALHWKYENYQYIVDYGSFHTLVTMHKSNH